MGGYCKICKKYIYNHGPKKYTTYCYKCYVIEVNLPKEKYYIYGYKGKQVRDNIHSYDVALFIDAFIKNPKIAEVYNLGGGKNNTISIIESFKLTEEITGNEMIYEYVDQNREGDHICYYSNLDKIKGHYTDWDITRNLNTIFEEIVISWKEKKRIQ